MRVLPDNAKLLLLLALGCAPAAKGTEAFAPEASGTETPGPVEAVVETAGPAAEFDHTHALWTALLADHVRGDDFDYGALAKDPARLETYVETLAAVEPAELAGWTKEQRFAFWINVYNAFTIQKVVDNYPLKSIKSLSRLFGAKSVFDDEFIPMSAHHPDGKDDQLSLNDVEHEILRVRFPDARVHAAINCASESCPPLRGEAFVAERLDAQLEEQMRSFVRDASRNDFDLERRRVRVSKIFSWFGEDFERDAGGVREYLQRYAAEEHRALIAKARLEFLSYDWDLNDVPEE
jgi:hypothetical protein